MTGVTFQPGLADQTTQPRRSNQGIQEAIKVLSLRLPKVVGAQAIAPSALLQSPGSAGNPRVDSIVESVLQKFFPQARPATGGMAPTAMPQPVEAPPPAYSAPQAPAQPDWYEQLRKNPPRMIVEGGGLGTGDFVVGGGGGPRVIPRTDGPSGVDGGAAFPPALIAPLPDLRRHLDWLPPPDAGRPYEM